MHEYTLILMQTHTHLHTTHTSQGITMFRLRIDEKSGLDVESFIQATGATTYVLVHHVLPTGNPHYHAYVECSLKENTFRQRIKRLSADLASSDYSLKKCREDLKNEYIQYLFNEKNDNVPTLIKSYNFDDNLLAELQANAKLVAAEYRAQQENRRNDKPTVYELAKEIHKSYLIKYPGNTVNNLGKLQLTPEGAHEFEEHLNIAISVCQKYNQPFEEHYLKRLVTTSLCLSESGKRTIVKNIMNKVFFHG